MRVPLGGDDRVVAEDLFHRLADVDPAPLEIDVPPAEREGLALPEPLDVAYRANAASVATRVIAPALYPFAPS